jgi:hypothetical protein
MNHHLFTELIFFPKMFGMHKRAVDFRPDRTCYKSVWLLSGGGGGVHVRLLPDSMLRESSGQKLFQIGVVSSFGPRVLL